jgi:hypothetical protein
MDMKFLRLKDVKRIEALSAENVQSRHMEEFERMPMEVDDAELFRLQKELEAGGNPLADKALEKVGEATDGLRKNLEAQYRKREKLLAEKSYLAAETVRRQAAARAMAKKAENTRLNMTNRRALDRIKSDAGDTARRMENNLRTLTGWDARHEIVSRRRRHLQRLMGCDLSDAKKYENELGSAMLRASRGNAFSPDRERAKALQNGNTAPYSDGEGLVVYGVNADSIATPFEETDYGDDDGRIMGYLALMEQMPESIRLIREGKSVAEILSDGRLREKAARLVSRETPVTVAQVSAPPMDDRYQVLDIESQRRVAVARLFGVGLVSARVETALRHQS